MKSYIVLALLFLGCCHAENLFDRVPGIKMVAFDLDLTANRYNLIGHLDYEGQDYWTRMREIAEHISPAFENVVKDALEKNVQICMATWADQNTCKIDQCVGGKNLVRDLLTVALGEDVPEQLQYGCAYPKYYQAAEPGSEKCLDLQENNGVENMPCGAGWAGKEWNINECIRSSGMAITGKELMFFDDQGSNIEQSREQFPGIVSVHVNGTVAFTMDDWQKAVDEYQSRPKLTLRGGAKRAKRHY